MIGCYCFKLPDVSENGIELSLWLHLSLSLFLLLACNLKGPRQRTIHVSYKCRPKNVRYICECVAQRKGNKFKRNNNRALYLMFCRRAHNNWAQVEFHCVYSFIDYTKNHQSCICSRASLLWIQMQKSKWRQ